MVNSRQGVDNPNQKVKRWQAGLSEQALQQASYELTAGLRVAAGQSSQYWLMSALAAHAPASRAGEGWECVAGRPAGQTSD